MLGISWRTANKMAERRNWVRFRPIRCLSSGIIFPLQTQQAYGTLYISVSATHSISGWMSLTCHHRLAWSCSMPYGSWWGLLMGHSSIGISCQLSRTYWWMDGRCHVKNDSFLLLQWEKMSAGENGWWRLVGGIRTQTQAKTSQAVLPWSLFPLCLLSTTPVFWYSFAPKQSTGILRLH